MAERDYTTFIPIDRNGSSILGALGVVWTGLLNTDTGKPFIAPHRSDKSVQVSGTLSTGGAVTIQGTNQQVYNVSGVAGSPAWATLSDPQGNALVINALGIKQVSEVTNAIRPNVTGGDGSTDLTVTMIISSTARL